MFDGVVHDQPRALVERMCAAWRAETRSAAYRLAAIGELFELRRAECGEREDWAVDTWAAVGAEVAEVFRAGDIDYRLLPRQ
jgi:hypothetical protein